MSIGLIIVIIVIIVLVSSLIAGIINFNQMTDLIVYGLNYKEKKAEEKANYREWKKTEKLNKKNKLRG